MSCQQFPALLTRELDSSVLTGKHTCHCHFWFERLKSITILLRNYIPNVLSCLFSPTVRDTFSRSSCGRLWCGGGGCTASDSLTTCHKLTIHIQSPAATLSHFSQIELFLTNIKKCCAIFRASTSVNIS